MDGKTKYIFHVTTDGSGTHILRGVFAGLKNQGISVHTVFSSSWDLAAKYLYGANAGQDDVLVALNAVLLEDGGVALEKGASRDAVFGALERCYAQYDVCFDFSKRLSRAVKDRSEGDIINIRKLIIEYQAWPDRQMDLALISQQRDPLDHAASLYERFSNQVDREHIIGLITENNRLIRDLEQEIKGTALADAYYHFTLTDIVRNSEEVLSNIRNLTQVPVPERIYVTPLSLGKWYMCDFAVNNRDNPDLLQVATDLKISYPRHNLFIMKIISVLRRYYWEAKIIIDTALGKVEGGNPINAKHARKLTAFHKLLMLIMPAHRKSNKDFYDTIKK